MRRLFLGAIILCIALSGCAKRQWTGQADSKQQTVKNMTMDRASGESSESNLKSLVLALIMYCQDHEEAMPSAMDLNSAQAMLEPYTKNPALWVDPRTQQSYGTNPSLAGKTISSISGPDEVAAFYETVVRPDGTRAVAFVDGHVALLREPQWQQVKQGSGIP